MLEVRKNELGRLQKAIPLRVGMQSILFAAPTLAMVVCFAVYGSGELVGRAQGAAQGPCRPSLNAACPWLLRMPTRPHDSRPTLQSTRLASPPPPSSPRSGCLPSCASLSSSCPLRSSSCQTPWCPCVACRATSCWRSAAMRWSWWTPPACSSRTATSSGRSRRPSPKRTPRRRRAARAARLAPPPPSAAAASSDAPRPPRLWAPRPARPRPLTWRTPTKRALWPPRRWRLSWQAWLRRARVATPPAPPPSKPPRAMTCQTAPCLAPPTPLPRPPRRPRRRGPAAARTAPGGCTTSI